MLKEKQDHRTTSTLIEEAEGKRSVAVVPRPPSTSTNGSSTNVGAPVAVLDETRKAPSKMVVGGVDLEPIVRRAGKVVVEAQPWLVAAVFLVVVLGGGRRRRG
ncbi:hypothetical protein HDU67_003572 [Dinochytrium kinnereticum]|nr:hypothetical protein HDU67_003572 [Dinochytrium kinnereticum]